MMRWEIAIPGIREKGAMTAIMLLNMHIVLRGMLDAFVGSWMRQTAAEAEQVRPRSPNRRQTP